MTDLFVTVSTFSSSVDAEMAKSKLQGSGIDSILFNDVISSMNPLYTLAYGGIELKVRQKDYDNAKFILLENLEN